MLSEIEITYFRSRIDDVLREGRPTAWQRKFLEDMRDKIERYGTRTRLSDKQMSILRKLTRIPSDADLTFITNTRRKPRPWRRTGRRWSYREIKFYAVLLMIIALFGGQTVMKWLPTSGFGFFQTAAPSAGFQGQSFTITDGDTIRMTDGTPVRLVGINTPEKIEPQCEREAALGIRATERLKELVASGKTTVTKVPCSCKPGTEGTDKCNHGRACGTLKVDGRDVGDILISEGLAVSFVCGENSCPPTPRPWCG